MIQKFACLLILKLFNLKLKKKKLQSISHEMIPIHPEKSYEQKVELRVCLWIREKVFG